MPPRVAVRCRGGGCAGSKEQQSATGAVTPPSKQAQAGAGSKEQQSATGAGIPPSKQAQAGGAFQELPPHFGPNALLASVESGAIAPLRGTWTVALHERGGRLQRRQDLPPEAFFSAKELRELVNMLGDDYGVLFVALSYRCVRARGVCLVCEALRNFVCISRRRSRCVWSFVVRWLSKDHPDPDGFHLSIVAKVAKLYMAHDGRDSPLTLAFQLKGLGAPDFALFWE